MSHMHKQIRDALVARCTGLATTGSNVFPQHVYAVPAGVNLPAVGVFALEEEISLSAMGNPTKHERLLSVALEGVAEGTDKGPSDTLAQMALELEVAISSDLTLGGLVRTMELEKIEYTYSGEGQKPSGAIRLTYAVEYRTTTTDPETSV